MPAWPVAAVDCNCQTGTAMPAEKVYLEQDGIKVFTTTNQELSSKTFKAVQNTFKKYEREQAKLSAKQFQAIKP